MPTVSDDYTKVLPVVGRMVRLDKPVLVAGFPDAGMIGSVCVNHIIEQLNMHQIAYIESQYVMPAAIFIGRRFRHAFRIYANDSGKICALICEVPVTARGIYSIVNTIVEWCGNAKVSGIVVLGGILPGNFSPSHTLERKALLLRNELAQGTSRQGASIGHADGLEVPDDAIVAGLAGSLLSVCASRGLSCAALMIPTVADAPDPEGAAIVLDALPKVLSGVKIDTSLLKQKVEMIKKHLEELLKMREEQLREYERQGSRETERMYK